MTDGPRQGLINHLIDLEFPDASNDEKCGVYTGSLPVCHDSDEAIYRIEDCRRAIKEFDEELQSLPTAELEQRYAELEPNIKRAEQERFFNQPYANADYAHWCKAAGWSIDEATALSFGKAPEKVKWESVEQYALFSQFAKQYMRIRHLVQRAEEMKQLSDPASPASFLAWAKRNDVKYPTELEEQVEERGHSIADWNSQHDGLDAQFESFRTAAETALNKKDSQITQLTQELGELNEQLQKANEALRKAKEMREPFPPRARRSALLIINAMAKRRYKFKPLSKRNQATNAILSDVKLEGNRLNIKTVLHWLQEAHDCSLEDRES